MIKYTPTNSQGRLEAGEHFCRVVSAVESMSAKGDQTIELELLIGRDGAHQMRDTLYNSERAAWRITQARACFGFDDAIGSEIEFAAADLVGCSGTVLIELGEPKKSGKYEGKQFFEIKRYLARDQAAEEVLIVEPDNIPF
jgi:hypothetical protein